MLPLSKNVADYLALGAAGGAFLAFVLAVLAHVRAARTRRSFAALEGPDGSRTVLDAVGAQRQETKALRAEIAQLRGELAGARNDLSDALRHVSVIRYDAFGDMGGRLSFTAALLDDAGDGLVLTSIHGRTEARTYAKGVKGATSEQQLSPEEQQAIELALRGPGGR